MRKRPLQLGAFAAAVAVVFALACSAEPDCPTNESTNQVLLPCDETTKSECNPIDGHVANAFSSVHLSRALLELLRARQFALHVSASDRSFDEPVRRLLAFVCRFPYRQAAVANVPIDELFPRAAFAQAVWAGCGVMHLRDGTRVVWPGVTWSP
jgi:hypothetical protein